MLASHDLPVLGTTLVQLEELISRLKLFGGSILGDGCQGEGSQGLDLHDSNDQKIMTGLTVVVPMAHRSYYTTRDDHYFLYQT